MYLKTPSNIAFMNVLLLFISFYCKQKSSIFLFEYLLSFSPYFFFSKKSYSLTTKYEIFEKRLNVRLPRLSLIRNTGTITVDDYVVERNKMEDEEMDRIGRENRERERGTLGISFHLDDLARERFVKELLRQKKFLETLQGCCGGEPGSEGKRYSR